MLIYMSKLARVFVCGGTGSIVVICQEWRHQLFGSSNLHLNPKSIVSLVVAVLLGAGYHLQLPSRLSVNSPTKGRQRSPGAPSRFRILPSPWMLSVGDTFLSALLCGSLLLVRISISTVPSLLTRADTAKAHLLFPLRLASLCQLPFLVDPAIAKLHKCNCLVRLPLSGLMDNQLA